MKSTNFVGIFAVILLASVVAPAVIASEDVPLRNWAVTIPPPEDDAPAKGRLRAQSNALNLTTSFVPIAPCRVVDTRGAAGPFGGPFFAAGDTRSYVIPGGPCAVPVADAYSLNITIVNYDTGAGNFLTAYPSGTPRPFTATVLWGNGINAVGNAAIIPAGGGGSIDVYTSGLTNVIIDINGYFGSPVTNAFARIQADGTLEPSVIPTITGQNQNILAGNVTHPAVGIYCFAGLSFLPRWGSVTLDNADAITTSNQIVSLSIYRGEALGTCATGAQARVVITQVNDTAPPGPVDARFFIQLGR